MPTNRLADDRREFGKSVGAKSDRERGTWAELIACAWLMDKGMTVYRRVGPHGNADIIVEIGSRFVGVDVALTHVNLTNPQRPKLTTSRTLSDAQENAEVILLWVTHDGVCSFDRAHLGGIYRAAAAQASETPDPKDGILHPTRGVMA